MHAQGNDETEIFPRPMPSMKAHIELAQEHMRRRDGISEEFGYAFAQSSADNRGHGGCMAAISQALPFAEPIDDNNLSLKVA